MAIDEKRISLKINLSSGEIELDAPASEFDRAIEKTKELAKSINLGGTGSYRAPPTEQASIAPAGSSKPSPASSPDKPRTKSKGGSSGRKGRIGAFEPVDLGLSEEQERSLRAFMEEKRPAEQSEEIAVAMYQGEKVLGRKGFNYDEVYTLLRASGLRELPKALDVVVSRMVADQWVIREGQGFSLKFVGRDYVEKLPTQADK